MSDLSERPPLPVAAGGGGEVASPAWKVDAEAIPADIAPDSTVEAGLEIRARSQWEYTWRRFLQHKAAVISLILLIIIFAAGIFSDQIVPYDPNAIDLNFIYHGPTTIGHHFFGTDEIGRDYLSRTIVGIKTSLEVGVFVAVISSILGLIVGMIAGYYGGWTDNMLMRFTDLFLTLPALVILLTASSLLGEGSQWRVSFILALFFWTTIARVVRGNFLSLREKEFVEAAKAIGAGDARIMFRHMLPNTLGPIVVNGTLAVGTAILVEAALSFLGFGIKPPTPSLGVLVAGAQTYPQAWWLALFPGLIIVLMVLCINFVGDGLRDALDPTQQRVRA